jgi:ribosome-binding factor A
VSRRTERIGNVIRAIVAEAIQSRLSDPRIALLTSITRVEVSDDLSIARINVSVMAPEAQQKLCIQALGHASGRLRAMVAHEMSLRQVPRLTFHLDTSLQKAFETVQAIDAAMAELGEPLPWEKDDDADSPAATDSADGDDPPAHDPADPSAADADHPHPTAQEDD